jgi:fructose-bisphosphate aldolase class I
MLEGTILKPNMVLSGLECAQQASVEEVAEMTIDAFRREVPAAVAGIVFLSGGQPPELASARLNEMNRRYAGKLPWPVSFSFSRAIQQPALELWRGDAKNVAAAQKALYHRARCNGAARRGEYTADMEKDAEVPA